MSAMSGKRHVFRAVERFQRQLLWCERPRSEESRFLVGAIYQRAEADAPLRPGFTEWEEEKRDTRENRERDKGKTRKEREKPLRFLIRILFSTFDFSSVSPFRPFPSSPFLVLSYTFNRNAFPFGTIVPTVGVAKCAARIMRPVSQLRSKNARRVAAEACGSEQKPLLHCGSDVCTG